ncbi:MAG TPA: Gldg family protein, partial [Gemmataceae bacterium]|nr:Gldg family protein [Gemmataceae bacterium]
MSDASPPTGTPTPAVPQTPAPSRLAPGHGGESPRTGPAFVAAGVMLGIMAAWIRAGFDPAPNAPYLLLVAAAAMCITFGAMRIFVGGTATMAAALAAAGSVVLLGIAGWLGWSLGVESIGQAVGLALFAVLGFGVAAGWSGGSLRDRLPGSLPTRIVLFLLAFAILALAIYLRAVRRIGNEYLPEQVALFLLGFALLFGAVWLYATINRTAEFLTTFFVVLGSAAGAILTLYAMSRGVIDWSKLTAEPWRGWVVGYALVAGLGLIYASLTLVESRSGSSSVARQSIYGFATIFCGILAFAVLVVFNIFIFRTVSTTMEWSKTRGLTSLSTASKNLLAGLDKKVEVYVLMSPQNFMHLQMKTMLDNAAAFAPSKFEVTYINPDSASEAERKKFDALANRFKEIISSGGREDQEMSRGVLLVYGPMPTDPNTPVPHAVIPVRRLFEEQMKTFTFKGEAEVMKELDF